jgi:hypothetical protein
MDDNGDLVVSAKWEIPADEEITISSLGVTASIHHGPSILPQRKLMWLSGLDISSSPWYQGQ